MGSPLGSSRAVREMFGAVAPRYDFLNHFLSLGCDIAWRRATAEALREVLARPGCVALDVCCGTGDLARELARRPASTTTRIFGADFSRPMLKLGQEKARRGRRAVTFLEADALSLPLRDNSLDAIASAFGFRNLVNYAQGLREMRRVLKPGGTAAILEFSRVTWPVFGALFRFYFRRVLPLLGAWISGVKGPYQYLPDSVAQFPDQEALAGTMRDAGFSNVRYRNFSGGVAALHLGEKAAGSWLQARDQAAADNSRSQRR